MKYFIHTHIMSWEIDELLVLVRKLKKSYYYLDKNNEYTFHVCLNLSNAIINWDKSKLEKKFFIDKFHSILQILDNSYNVEWEIYEGDEPTGHLDMEKSIFKRHKEYDGFLSACPDIHFHETLLSNMFSAFEVVKNEFIAITPQTHRLWDGSWNELVNEECKSLSYENWRAFDVYDAEWITENNLDNISVYKVMRNKWAGWFDLRSSNLVGLFPPPNTWAGFGPYDTYLMTLIAAYKAKNSSFDFQQYCVKNQVIGKYSNHNLKKFYKEYLTFKNTKWTQRKQYGSEINMLVKMKLEEETK